MAHRKPPRRLFEIRVINDKGDVEYVSRLKGQVIVERGYHDIYSMSVSYIFVDLERLDANGSLEYVFDLGIMSDEDRRRYRIDKKVDRAEFQKNMMRMVKYSTRQVYRDSASGMFVSAGFAKKHPNETYSSTVRVPNYYWVPRKDLR